MTLRYFLEEHLENIVKYQFQAQHRLASLQCNIETAIQNVAINLQNTKQKCYIVTQCKSTIKHKRTGSSPSCVLDDNLQIDAVDSGKYFQTYIEWITCHYIRALAFKQVHRFLEVNMDGVDTIKWKVRQISKQYDQIRSQTRPAPAVFCTGCRCLPRSRPGCCSART